MQLYDHIANVLTKAVRDQKYMAQVLADPNAVMKAEGADIGQSHTTLDWNDKTNCLSVHVARGGADWNGSIQLKIEK